MPRARGRDGAVRCAVRVAEPTVWRVCPRVADDDVAFAVKVTNPGPRPVGVTVRVQYARHQQFHVCPRATGAYAVIVPHVHPGRVVRQPDLLPSPRPGTSG